MFKKLNCFFKKKEEEGKKEKRKTPQNWQKPNVETEVYSNNKKCDQGKKKKVQKLNWISQC